MLSVLLQLFTPVICNLSQLVFNLLTKRSMSSLDVTLYLDFAVWAICYVSIINLYNCPVQDMTFGLQFNISTVKYSYRLFSESL
jgi:hypothetical protein